MPPALLRLREYTVVRNGKPVFQPLSLTLAPGQTTLVQGDSGAGKTSLYRAMLAGDPSSCRGRMHFDGLELTQGAQEAWTRFWSESAFIAEDAPAELVESELLGTRAGRGARDLSFGARLRATVELARASKPRLLVIDEFSGALDELARQELLHTLRAEQAERNLAILVLCRDPSLFAELKPSRVQKLTGSVGIDLDQERLEAWDSSPYGLVPRDKALLSCQSVSVVFGTVGGGWRRKASAAQILHAINFEVGWGQTLAVVGASPSGKTTLALALAGVLTPSLGRVLVRDRSSAAARSRSTDSRSRAVQLCLDDPRSGLDPRMTTRQLLMEALRVATPTPHAKVEKEASQLLVAFGLGAGANLRPPELSSAEACLLGLARALCQRPSVLLLDNALAALGRPQQDSILKLLARRSRDAHASQVLFTNDLGLAFEASDRVAVLYAGTLVELGSTKRVFEHPLHPYARALLSQRDRSKVRLQLLLEGAPPDPAALPSGCTFHPRCARYERGRCEREEPELGPHPDDSEHLVACFRPHD